MTSDPNRQADSLKSLIDDISKRIGDRYAALPEVDAAQQGSQFRVYKHAVQVPVSQTLPGDNWQPPARSRWYRLKARIGDAVWRARNRVALRIGGHTVVDADDCFC